MRAYEPPNPWREATEVSPSVLRPDPNPFIASSGARTADPAGCTDANGVYHLRVSPGVYNVVFYDPTGAYVAQWYAGAAYEGLATPVPVETGGQATGIDAVLAAA